MESARVINFNPSGTSAVTAAAQAPANTIASTTAAAAVGTTKAAAATAASTGAAAFFTTKAGIILISVVATAVVATAITVPVVMTQNNDDSETDVPNLDTIRSTENYIDTTILTSKITESERTSEAESPTETAEDSKKETDEENTNTESPEETSKESSKEISEESSKEISKESSKEISEESSKETSEESSKETSEESSKESSGEDPVEPSIKEYEAYKSDMISLTQNNFIDCLETTEIERDKTTNSQQYFNIGVQISYKGSNNDINDKYVQILAENNELIASSTTYDEIRSDKKLYLNGQDTGKSLFKHIFSVGLYGGNISDDEKAVKKVMKINPASSTNYVTGLYAPPGELITVEISAEDLANIGGSLTFLIGQYTQNNGLSINRESIGIKRVPNLGNSLTIKTTTGYIGSFIGGPIYIANPSKKRPFTLTISGAVPYKHIIFGRTTKSDFDAMKDYTAPFFEFDIRDSIRYSGALYILEDAGIINDYENNILNLLFWDKCLRTSRQVPTGSNIKLGIHFLFDPCINSNGALALAYVGNNWCQVPPSFGMALNYETASLYGVWGHIHELNHHFQKYGFANTANEVTNNVINLVEYVLYTQISGLRNEFSNAALTKISGNHNNMNPEHCLKSLVSNPPSAADEIRFYEPILQAFGPFFFINVTRYGRGYAGVDLFYESLVKVLHYDFTYYIESILNLVISESKKIELEASNYPIFIPVSSIYQTGRYFTIDNVEYFSNTSFPYRIPRGGDTKLDFENHLIVPNGFTATIESITPPKYGTLNKLSDKIYTYSPDAVNDLSGILNMTITLRNTDEDITSTVKLGLQFEVDNSKSTQTNYIFDEAIYTNYADLETAIANGFEGYTSTEFFPNFAGAMTGIKEGNIGVWEGKFKIDDDGYKYILYRGGRGPSKMYIKINEETEYHQMGYIIINQGAYMFVEPSYSYYQIDLKKDDIIYFKAILLGSTINSGGTASLYIGISKENVVSKVRTLGANDIVGIDSDFNTKYEFYSGDPFYDEKQFDSLSFFEYSLVSLTSPNFASWDGSETNGLSKLIDRNSNTYLHTKKNTPIRESNPLTLDFDLGREYYFDYIYFVKRGPNNYAPKNVTISISTDGNTWVEKETLEVEINGNLAEINLSEKLHTRYIRIHITKTTTENTGYIALTSVEFIEKNVEYIQKRPEYAQIYYPKGETNAVTINFANFPHFGHSYIIKAGSYMDFSIKNTTGVRLKTCHKTNAEVKYTVKKGDTEIKADTINIKEGEDVDFPVVVTGLERGDYEFRFDIVSGKFDFDYILYEI